MILITEIGLRSTVNQRLKRSIFFFTKMAYTCIAIFKKLKKIEF